MKVLHAGWFEMGSVHGTHQALWQLARAQVDAGHAVTILNLGWESGTLLKDLGIEPFEQRIDDEKNGHEMEKTLS